jgi:hypothetical protein
LLANRPPLTDAPVPEVALRTHYSSMHPSPEGERFPARSQRWAIADLGGLAVLSQRCSSPVFLGNFVPPGDHFGDFLMGTIDPVIHTISVRGWVAPLKPGGGGGGLKTGMKKLLPWSIPILRGKLEFSSPGPAHGWEGPHCYPSATPRK